MEYVILAVALVAIVLGANYLVVGSVAIARKLKVSDFVIGALVIGIGTSMPEMVVSLIGVAQGNSSVAIGNVIGSNIFNVFAILGMTAAIFPITVSRNNRRFEMPLYIIVSVLLLLLTYNFFSGSPAQLGRTDGMILIGLFVFFIVYSFLRDRQNHTVSSDVHERNVPTWIAVLEVAGGLAVLIAGCHYFVEEAVVIARKFGVDDAFISITLIACGTSLPELAASIAAAVKKSTQLALGNIIGSNIFNITLILGMSSILSPLDTGGITLTDYVVMVLAAIVPAVFGLGGKISRAGGIVMVLCFLAYNAYLIGRVVA